MFPLHVLMWYPRLAKLCWLNNCLATKDQGKVKNYSKTFFKPPMKSPNYHNDYRSYRKSSTYSSHYLISTNRNTAENTEIFYVHTYATRLESKSKDTCA